MSDIPLRILPLTLLPKNLKTPDVLSVYNETVHCKDETKTTIVPISTSPPRSIVGQCIDALGHNTLHATQQNTRDDVTLEAAAIVLEVSIPPPQQSIQSDDPYESRHISPLPNGSLGDDTLEVCISSSDTKDIATMTAKEMRAYAVEHDIPLNGANTKKQILQILRDVSDQSVN